MIENFNPITDVHDLPPIFHYWSHKFLRPRLEAVLEVSSPDDFFLKYISDAARRKSPATVEIASLGAGNADLELRLAHGLVTRDISNFRFLCLDINRAMLGRGAQTARDAGLNEHFQFVEMNITHWQPPAPRHCHCQPHASSPGGAGRCV